MKKYRWLCSLVAALLTGCTGLIAPPRGTTDGVAVSLHGVNHTDRPFSYGLVDPTDPTNTGGGEHIGPFSAGGIMCCYTLPKQWVPGIRVQVHSTHWERGDASGKLTEVKQVYTVEVPPYVDGKVGELWVVRTKEGTIELVSSNVQPNHPAWPGKAKGWPEPSVEYQRERWEIYRRTAESYVNNYRQALRELESSSESHLLKSWEHDTKYDAGTIKIFEGPADPRYKAHLLNRYSEGLMRSTHRLELLLRARP